MGALTNMIVKKLARGADEVDELLFGAKAITRPRARHLSPAALAPRHVQAIAPPAPPLSGKAAQMGHNFNISGTIDSEAIAHDVAAMFEGGGSVINTSSRRSAESVLGRVSGRS